MIKSKPHYEIEYGFEFYIIDNWEERKDYVFVQIDSL
jgi:hypothetical protein